LFDHSLGCIPFWLKLLAVVATIVWWICSQAKSQYSTLNPMQWCICGRGALSEDCGQSVPGFSQGKTTGFGCDLY
jgi:hypothetical protein